MNIYTDTITPTQIGIATLAAISLLSGYAIIMRIRDSLRETPDPKLTYVTLTAFDKFRQQFMQLVRDNRREYSNIDEKRSRTIANVYELIRKNGEHIAALIAQNEMQTQRLTELSVKTDRLAEKQK